MGFLDAVTNFFAPISNPLVSVSQSVASTLYGGLGAGVAPAFQSQQAHTLGTQLFAAGAVASAAVVAAPVAAAALPAVGGLGGIAALGLSHVQDITNVLDDAGSTIDQGIQDTTDDLLPIGDLSDADFA